MSITDNQTSDEIISEKDNSNGLIQSMTEQFWQMYQLSRQQGDVSWQHRLHQLEQLKKLISDNTDAICHAISQDFRHRSHDETIMVDIFPSLEGIRHAKKHGKDWMKPQKVSTGKWFLPASSHIQSQPLGVVGIMSPWNYPLNLVAGPLTAALVAGNRAMIKVSEYSPNFAHWLAKTLPVYFDKDEVCLVQGGVQVAQAFSKLPFDHLLFTGSTSVGKHIMRAAADNLTPVTLELGGKSPVIIIDKDILPHAVNRIWTGKMMNSGQTCIAPDYVLLPDGLQDEFIGLSKKWMSKHYPKIGDNEDVTFIINHKQFDRIHDHLKQAQQQACVHKLTTATANRTTGFMPPVVLTELSQDSLLLTEEIFGPVLPLVGYDSLDDAIDYVNARPRPLALYPFGQDDGMIERILQRTVSGGVSINETIYHVAQHDLPFGGVGASGMGHYHGKHGFDTFSHQKAVFRQAKVNFVDILQPPYGKVFDKLMKVAVRW